MYLSYPGLSAQPITMQDRADLLEIYADTRKEELAQLVYWTPEMKTVFLEQQFSAQHTFYQENYPGAFFGLLKIRQSVVGRLYLWENADRHEFRIIDIAVLSDWRNRGIGTSVFRDVMGRAGEQNYVVTIHVEVFNRARKLYERLGFKQVGETDGVYILMKWTALP